MSQSPKGDPERVMQIEEPTQPVEKRINKKDFDAIQELLTEEGIDSLGLSPKDKEAFLERQAIIDFAKEKEMSELLLLFWKT